MKKAMQVITTRDGAWRKNASALIDTSRKPELALTDSEDQVWAGFGGCFNEIGWKALSGLNASQRESVISDLFEPGKGCCFNLCRLPIGATVTQAELMELLNVPIGPLREALQVLEGVEGIRFCHFEEVDVVRHHLVQRIVRAYDSYGRAQQLPLELGDAEQGTENQATGIREQGTEKSKLQ